MKKVLLILLAVVILIVGSVLWVLRGMGVSDPALLLPEETVALAAIPDLPRTALRWPQTTLAKIGAEPQMKAFLEQPLKYLTSQKGGNEASGILWNLKPGRIFVAAVNASAQDAALLIGFQFWGGKPAHDAAVERLRTELSLHTPSSEVKTETYEGAEIRSSTHGAVTLFNASHGQWGFLSNNLPALKDALDRAAGRRKEGSLAASARYQKVRARLSASPDVLVYLQPPPLLDALVAAGQSLGAQKIPAQLEQIRQVEAVGYSTLLDGANLKDTLFFLRPNPPDNGALSHEMVRITSPDTLAFFNFLVNFSQIAAAAATTPGASSLQNLPLYQHALEAFGPECAVAVSWQDQLLPSGVLAIAVRDQAKAEQTLQEALALLPGTTATESAGATYYTSPAVQNTFVSPALALTDGRLFLGLSAAAIDSARQSLKSGASLESAPVFASAKETYRSANESFGFLDARGIFEKVFPHARQALAFAAMMPGVSDVINPDKVPDTETVAKHLQPIVFSQSRMADGTVLESSGPITLNHAILLGGGAASLLRPAGI